MAGEQLPPLAQDQILWIDVVGREAAEANRLRTLLSLDDAVSAYLQGEPAGPSLSNYGDYFHCSIVALRAVATKNGGGPIMPSSVRLDLVVGKNWLITVADEELVFLREFRDRDRGETLIGKLSSGTLAASLLDWHLGAYLAALETLEGWLDVLDVRLLASKATDQTLLKNVVEGRRVVSRLRRNLAPQRAVFYGLARPDFALVAGSDAREAFHALERRYDRVLDAIEHSRELVRGSFDLFATRIAEATNVLIRRLTFVSVALGVIGAAAGIFGMNFHTPFTESGVTGFWVVVGGLVIFVLGGLAVAKARRWI